MLHSFYGGSDTSWAPPFDTCTYFRFPNFKFQTLFLFRNFSLSSPASLPKKTKKTKKTKKICESTEQWQREDVQNYGWLGWLGHHRPRVTDRPVPGKFSSWRPELLGANPSSQKERVRAILDMPSMPLGN